MPKMEKIHPVTPSIVSNRVVISNKVLSGIVNAVNTLIESNNAIIDKLESLDGDVTTLKTTVHNNQQAVQALAQAVQTLQNI